MLISSLGEPIHGRIFPLTRSGGSVTFRLVRPLTISMAAGGQARAYLATAFWRWIYERENGPGISRRDTTVCGIWISVPDRFYSPRATTGKRVTSVPGPPRH